MTQDNWDRHLKQKGFHVENKVLSTGWTLYSYDQFLLSIELVYKDMPGVDFKMVTKDYFSVIISMVAKGCCPTVRVTGFISDPEEIEQVLDAIISPKL
jgi:hypothetical protein